MPAQPNFEKDLEQLEKIVAELEAGELPLDASLKRFEEGVKLTQRCEKALSEAEKKIEALTRGADGELAAAPFEAGDAADETAATPAPRRARRAAADDDADGDAEDAGEDAEGGLLF